MMIMGSTVKKKKEAKDKSLIDLVLSWSIPDIMNQRLYKDKVHPIPDTFSSVKHYLDSFVNPLIEETHADLRSSLTSLLSAPAGGILVVETGKGFKDPENLSYSIIMKTGEEKIDGAYEPECGDLIAITELRPKCIDDLNGRKRLYTVALVLGMKDEDTEEIPILSSKRIDFGKGDRLFAVYLTNLTTNTRIWAALHPGEGGNTKIVNSILDVTSHMEEKCTLCCMEETKMIKLLKLTEELMSLGLNDSQRGAVLDSVSLAECRHQNKVKLLWGPPGTGKTKTIATLGYILLRMRCRTLVCAPTNVAVLGITKRLMFTLSDSKYLTHGTYGLGDVVLFGNGKRMKIERHEELHDIFLDYRVRVLAHCFAPLSGLRGNLDKMMRLLEDPQGQYQLYLLGQQVNEDNSESNGENEDEMSRCSEEDLQQTMKRKMKEIITPNIGGNKDKKRSYSKSKGDKKRIVPLTFDEFVTKTFVYVRKELIFCLTALYTRMPTSLVPLEILKLMINVRDLLYGRLLKQAITWKEEVGLMSKVREFFYGSPTKIVNFRMAKQECLQAMKYLRKNFAVQVFIEYDKMKFFNQKNAYLRNFCLQNASLIFCTVSSSSKLHSARMPLEVVIIDEAAQLKECETNIPLQLCELRHAILVGDEKQLPAMVISKICEKAGFGRSLFERLVMLGHSKHLLDVQYRMHPSVSLFPNREFYGKQIKDGWNVTEKTYEKQLLDGKLFGPYSFINVAHAKEEFDSKHSRKNILEASVVAEIVSRLSKQCYKSGQKVSVGCLSPYKGQVVAIEELLGKAYSSNPKDTFSVNVRSVDGFQGGEEDVIIISTVRCNGNGSVGFLDNRNRANVALTRAKYCLWIIGSSATLLNSGSVWKKLVLDAKDRGCFHNVCDDKNLSLAVDNALVEARQLSSLFSVDSRLFKEAKWKVFFSMEFNNSITRLHDLDMGIVREVVSLVVKVSNGWREQNSVGMEGDSWKLLEWCHVKGELRMIWTVDIIRDYLIDTQVIRVLDILPQSKTADIVKSFCMVVGKCTVTHMNRCLYKRTEGDLLVPMTWAVDVADELASRLESTSLGDQRTGSHARSYGRKSRRGKWKFNPNN